MGQYYLAINTNKKQYLSPYDFNCGAKLMESCYITNNGITNNYMSHLTQLMQTDWQDDDVIMLGDYADTVWAKSKINKNTHPNAKQYFNDLLNDPHYKKLKNKNAISHDLITNTFANCYQSSIKNYPPISQYLCNTKTKEYIDLYNLPIEYDYEDDKTNETTYVSIYPLPLLIAVGNGLGNGDYYGINNHYVGYWADSSGYIVFRTQKPKDYIALNITFTENKNNSSDDLSIETINQKSTYLKRKIINLFYKKYDHLTYDNTVNFYAYLEYDLNYGKELLKLNIQSISDLINLLLQIPNHIKAYYCKPSDTKCDMSSKNKSTEN